jgi:predicted DNA-binding antitoxin AbrB/MazE fold protein
MTITIEAVYEDGVLKPASPLPLKDHETVRISIHPPANWVDDTYGIVGWTGDHETLQRFALDPELDSQEASRRLTIFAPDPDSARG